eukprot:s967_g11.t1
MMDAVGKFNGGNHWKAPSVCVAGTCAISAAAAGDGSMREEWQIYITVALTAQQMSFLSARLLLMLGLDLGASAPRLVSAKSGEPRD